MKKILLYSLSTILLFSLSACKSTNLKSETANSSFTDVEDTSDVEKILAEANKRLAEEKEKRLEEKQNRIQSGEEQVEITGEIIDLFNKPDSGLEFYQVTVKVANVKNDSNELYKGSAGKEYIYFVEPSENKDIDFKTLKPGTKIKINVFQDAYVTEGDPKQTSEEDVTSIQIVE
ncbi:hypothetical protein [Vagococcus fluvialis]|uniref:hypothetical protein n=1 Tax=Vagococcus fluvialis TaxID=2738 RepID=UPI001A8F56F8|nr:hypothetical protein [Vagococcus fluvialis]MBO0436746.1 hypothetical protein [Vagococcus fluvialis]